MLAALEPFLEAAEKRRLRIRIPREDGLMQKIKGAHFHYKPELFFQLKGVSHFRFPRETLDLHPDEMLVIPACLPHDESITPERGAFRNLVAGFYSHTISLHFGAEFESGKPDIECIDFFDAPDLATYLTLAQALVQAYHTQTPARESVLLGLVTTLLAMLKNLVTTGMGDLNADLGKVFQTKWLVREQFSNPELNVARIAGRLGCSPDYLSHLFHKETGEKLIHYIQRIRIEGATLALENSALYVSEIAYASGFSDPAYFARVFKNHKGESPAQFRERLNARRREAESAPKTIYYDHVDYSHGRPAGEKPAGSPAAKTDGVARKKSRARKKKGS